MEINFNDSETIFKYFLLRLEYLNSSKFGEI